MILNGRKLIETTSKRLNKLYPAEGIDLWRSKVVSMIENKDLLSGAISYDSELLATEVYDKYKEEVSNKAKLAARKEDVMEIKDFTVDFQSWKAENEFRRMK